MVDSVDETMFLRDSVRPCFDEHMTQRLRMADAVERLSHAVLDQPIDAFARLTICRDPVLVVLPRFVNRCAVPPGPRTGQRS